MTTLVTGAAGFLGSHVARQLVARGESVRVLLRPSSQNRAIADLSLEYVTGDLRDTESLDRALKGVDARLSCRRRLSPLGQRFARTFTIPTSAARKIFSAAAKRAGVEQFIYTSTVATIAVDRPAPPNETTDAKLEEMIGHYKRSKWMAEREALNAAKKACRSSLRCPPRRSARGTGSPRPPVKSSSIF